MAKSYTVIYRTGGTERCEWHKVLDRYPTVEEANAKAEELRRMGYGTIIHDTAELAAGGMPEGWNA